MSNQNLKEGYEKLLLLCRQIHDLPIGDWINDLNHAETVAPIIDPTLYRKYIYSKKPEILKKLMHAAWEVKRTWEEVEPTLMELFMEELNAKAQEQQTQSKS